MKHKTIVAAFIALSLVAFNIFAASDHFPLLRSHSEQLKKRSIGKELQQQLLEEIAVERALWDDEVASTQSKLSTNHSPGSALAMSRLTEIDAKVRGRLQALDSAIEGKQPLPPELLESILSKTSEPEWQVLSGSDALIPSKNRFADSQHHAKISPAVPEEYNKPPAKSALKRTQQSAEGGDFSAPSSTEAEAIAAKASELNHEPVALYRFVLNEIRSEHYFGSMKSPSTVLASGSGNDVDQAALLQQLFLASGFEARLIWGVEQLPVSAVLNHFQVETTSALERLLTRAGIPWDPVVQGGHPVAYRLERVWCEAWLPFTNFRGVILDQNGSTWAPLDPEWKTMLPRNPRRVLSEMGLDSQVFLQQYLSGTLCAGDPQTANGCGSAREVIASQINAYLQSQGATDTYESLGNSRRIEAQNETLLPSSLPGKIVSINGVYFDLPESLHHRLRLRAASGASVLMDTTVNVSDLSGREGMIWFVPATDADQAIADSYGGDLWAVPPYLINATPQILARGTEIARGSAGIGMGMAFDLTYTLSTPTGEEITFTNHAMTGVPIGISIGAGKQAYSMPGNDPANTLEILSKLANDYMDGKAQFEEELAALTGVTVTHRFPSVVGISSEVEAAEDLGLIRSLQWKAITVDADVWGAQAENADRAAIKSWTILTSLNASTLERKVFEAYNVNSVSAEKALLLASQQSIPILHIDETNIAGILPGLPYPASIKGEIQSWVNGGGVADIPESPLSYIEWAGVGYILSDPATGEARYQLAGSLSGGITVVPIEDVLHAISDFLKQNTKDQVNPDPGAAVRLVAIGWENVPIV